MFNQQIYNIFQFKNLNYTLYIRMLYFTKNGTQTIVHYFSPDLTLRSRRREIDLDDRKCNY